MQDKVVLVTGATGSIGEESARAFAATGATVVMLARDAERANAQAASLRSATGNPNVAVLRADLADPASVRAASDAFKRDYGRLHVLVNNAAVLKRQRELVGEGLEAMFATNHLGPFLLTNALLDVLKASAPARVINVTAPAVNRLNFEDLQGARRFNALSAFGATKMCNLLFTFELARRLEGTGIGVNAYHPGLVRSRLLKEAPAPLRVLVDLASKSPAAAAAGLVQLGLSPRFEGVSGRFFKYESEIRAAAYAHDPQVQRRLWETSAGLVGLDP